MVSKTKEIVKKEDPIESALGIIIVPSDKKDVRALGKKTSSYLNYVTAHVSNMQVKSVVESNINQWGVAMLSMRKYGINPDDFIKVLDSIALQRVSFGSMRKWIIELPAEEVDKDNYK